MPVVFLEDYEIYREMLVRRWIAEGFISEERGHRQKEVAENYFYELINKSMVQPMDIGYDGKVRACRVHDMILEIIISKSVEDNFVTLVGGGQTSLTNRHGFIRRLSVHHIDKELASALANEDLSHVLSLTVTTSGCSKHFPSLAKFEALRVLDIEHRHGLEFDMNNTDKLFQLKYLRLSNISKVPPRIEMLHDLETLDLSSTGIVKLPSGNVLLTKLQYLLVPCCKIPNGIGNMRSLQAMSDFDLTKSSLDAMEELGNLTRLNVHSLWSERGFGYERHEEMLLSSLCKLSCFKLHSLHIVTDLDSVDFIDSWYPAPSSLQIFDMDGDSYLLNIPKWISPRLTSGFLRDSQALLTFTSD